MKRSVSEEALREVHSKIARYCAKIAELFRPGVKVTVIIRNPDREIDQGADLFIGDDEPLEVIGSLERLMHYQRKAPTQ